MIKRKTIRNLKIDWNKTLYETTDHTEFSNKKEAEKH